MGTEPSAWSPQLTLLRLPDLPHSYPNLYISMNKTYKFTITLTRELTEEEHYQLEGVLAAQCEEIDMPDGEEVQIGYITGSERLEEL